LHNLFGIEAIFGDADRQTVRTAAIRNDKFFGRRRLRETERLDKPTVAIESCWSGRLVARSAFAAGGGRARTPRFG
jgi:hypothetical protein